MSYCNLIVNILLSFTLLPLSYTAKPSLPTGLDYLDPETWTHLSQNVLLHDLESVEPDPELEPPTNHQIRHFTDQNNKNNNNNKAAKDPKKGKPKGQRQNNNGNNGSYNNNKGKQGT